MNEKLSLVLDELSKASKIYAPNLSLNAGFKTLPVTAEMMTSEGFLFGGFSYFEAAATLFSGQLPSLPFDFEIEYKSPIATGNILTLSKRNNTQIKGEVNGEIVLLGQTRAQKFAKIPNVAKQSQFKASVQGIEQISEDTISYAECDRRSDLSMLFHLCCFFDRGTWYLGQKKYEYANFLTKKLSFDVLQMPAKGPLFLHSTIIEKPRENGSSLIVEADAIDSKSKTFAKTKCTLVRICPKTKRPIAI